MALINTTTTGILGTTVYGDGAGALTVQKDGVTQGIFGNQPAFSAIASTTQTITNNTFTKVAIDTEYFDTNSNFDTSNYRFTPTVAGYYQVNGTVRCIATTISQAIVALYKNGSILGRGSDLSFSSTVSLQQLATHYTDVIYMNGTSDYIELYGLISIISGTPQFQAVNTAVTSRFSAALVRAA